MYDEPVHRNDILYCLPISVETHGVAIEEEKQRVMKMYGVYTIDELLYRQERLLAHGMVMRGMTWCGNKVPNFVSENSFLLTCLLLKKIREEGMEFRRVGYAKLYDGKCFESVVPDVLEII